MYSQNNEEDIIINYFKDFRGKFLDIGAFDGKTLSNTYRLSELGWKGICVEPSPKAFKLLLKNYEGNKDIECLDYAVATKSGKLEFFESEDLLSTLNEKHLSKWNNVKFDKISVNCITPDELFDKYGYDFDMINIDVESTNIDLFNIIDFSKFKNLKLLCIEHDGHYNHMAKIMVALGFRQILLNAENIIFVK